MDETKGNPMSELLYNRMYSCANCDDPISWHPRANCEGVRDLRPATEVLPDIVEEIVNTIERREDIAAIYEVSRTPTTLDQLVSVTTRLSDLWTELEHVAGVYRGSV